MAAIRATLPDVAANTIAAIKSQVAGYADLPEDEGTALATGVRIALEGFLGMAAAAPGAAPVPPAEPAMQGAYQLGQLEARSGRTLDSLLTAYRVGARTAWQGVAGAAVAGGLPAGEIVDYAAEVFAYIDALTASSVAGHADELASEGRLQERLRERLSEALLSGAEGHLLEEAVFRAAWTPPATLVVVLLPESRVDRLHARLGARALRPGPEVAGLPAEAAVMLLPGSDLHLVDLLQAAAEEGIVVMGPELAWRRVAASYRRAVRAWEYLASTGPAPGLVRADDVLTEIVVSSDEEALADLRARALAPLAELPHGRRQRLSETLRAWLLLRGRRDAVAAALFVHPQTVRYRMTQVRDLFGDALDDPVRVQELVVALAAEPRRRDSAHRAQ